MKNRYRCPECKANLDAGERCNCQDEALKSSSTIPSDQPAETAEIVSPTDLPQAEVLMIGFDMAGGPHVTALTVARFVNNDYMEVVKTFFGDAAKDMYRRLTEPDGEEHN